MLLLFLYLRRWLQSLRFDVGGIRLCNNRPIYLDAARIALHSLCQKNQRGGIVWCQHLQCLAVEVFNRLAKTPDDVSRYLIVLGLLLHGGHNVLKVIGRDLNLFYEDVVSGFSPHGPSLNAGDRERNRRGFLVLAGGNA